MSLTWGCEIPREPEAEPKEEEDEEEPPDENNECPVISSITYTETSLYVYEIEAHATDPNGDSLTYDWSVSGGWILSEDGDTIVWEAETSYIWYITVDVSDGDCTVSETLVIDN